MAIDPWRFYLIYIIFGFVCIFFCFISYKVLKRDPKDKINQYFSLFFITGSIGLSINLLYSSFSDPSLQLLASFLNILTWYFLCLSTGFLLLSIFLLYQPQKIVKTLNQIIFILAYNGILSVLFLIPAGVEVKILPDGTQLYAVWNFSFFIYILIILLISFSINFRYSIKIYKHLTIEDLARKMKSFIIGMSIFYYIAIGACFTNYLNFLILRQIYAMSSTVIIIGVLLIYYGMGTGIKRSYNYLSKESY